MRQFFELREKKLCFLRRSYWTSEPWRFSDAQHSPQRASLAERRLSEGMCCGIEDRHGSEVQYGPPQKTQFFAQFQKLRIALETVLPKAAARQKQWG